MQIQNPFKQIGHLNIGVVYALDQSTYKPPLDGAGNATLSEVVEWDKLESIVISFGAEYKLNDLPMLDKSEGKFGFKATWRASFSATGLELWQDGAQPKALPTASSGPISVAAGVRVSESRAGDKHPFVEMVVGLVAGEETEGITVGLQAGPISAGTSIGGSKGSAGSEMVIRLNLIVPHPPAPASAPVPKIPPSLLTGPILLFKEDADTLSPKSIGELQAWVGKVKDLAPLGTVIALGDLPIGIQGFASTTGSAAYNKGETDRRIKSVITVLKSSQYFGSSQLKFDIDSHGKGKADGKGPVNAFNRRVELIINAGKATKAMEAFLKQ